MSSVYGRCVRPNCNAYMFPVAQDYSYKKSVWKTASGSDHYAPPTRTDTGGTSDHSNDDINHPVAVGGCIYHYRGYQLTWGSPSKIKKMVTRTPNVTRASLRNLLQSLIFASNQETEARKARQLSN